MSNYVVRLIDKLIIQYLLGATQKLGFDFFNSRLLTLNWII